ncbi:MAG: hypothetical protein FJY80_12930 [Candidatus Aminicenantes bacterium]|nr:hypothetical protein [Candidatus Aminicenantes bacterium]
MDVDIDYDNLDVGAIMDQVKKTAASRPPEPGREEPLAAPASSGGPPVSGGAAPQPSGPPGFKARLKAKALKAMAPFFPVIRLFALPLHEELQAVVRSLDRTNRELDARTAAAGLRFRDLDRAMEYIKLLHTLNHNLVLEVTKLRIELDGLKSRARVLEKDFEYAGRRQKALEDRVLR